MVSKNSSESSPQPQYYLITEEDLKALEDYTTAALNGEESKVVVRRLFNTQYSVIRSRPAKSSDKVLDELSQLCAYLHYSHSENERMAKETKSRIAREILKGRMFEDCMILDVLEEFSSMPTGDRDRAPQGQDRRVIP